MFRIRYCISEEMQRLLMSKVGDEQPIRRVWESPNPIPATLLKHKFVDVNENGLAYLNISLFEVKVDFVVDSFESVRRYLRVAEKAEEKFKAAKAAQKKDQEKRYINFVNSGKIPPECIRFTNRMVDGVNIRERVIVKDVPGLEALVERANERSIEKAKRERAEIERKKEIEAEKSRWIKENGSDRLQMMTSFGYNNDQTYEIERGELELPGFVYNKGDKEFTIHERANPTSAGLLREREFKKRYENVRIVWAEDVGMTGVVDMRIPGGDFCECLMIKPYWSRFGFLVEV